MFPPNRFTVYDHDYWWSDKWDAVAYGKEYDFSRPFFEQFGELMKVVPWFNSSTINLVNSEYCNNASDLKNCYLVFDADYCENLAYSVGTQYSKDSFDLSACTYCERSAHNFYCHNSYDTFYSLCCEQCVSVWFSKDCIGCSNCFGCVGLRNKSYYIFNKPYSKEEYFKKLKEFKLDSYAGLQNIKKQAREVWLTFPVKFMHGRQNTNISGDYIYNSKNVKDSFWVREGENLRYMQSCSYAPNNDSYDMCVAGLGSELCYEGAGIGIKTSEVKFACFTYADCYRLTYVMNCHNSSDCFGCVGLRNKQFCIFNKQYTLPCI